MYQIFAYILIVYLIFSVFVYFIANSNIIPLRSQKNYTIGFNAQLKYTNSIIDPRKKVAYWVAKQSNSAKSVILLHGFSRTSKKMEAHASIYWDLGYNVYLIDNLGHGYSSFLLYPSGYRYSFEVRNIIKEEHINSPIIHGLSMGAIAANIICQLEPDTPKAIVCEALAYHFKDLYVGLLRYLRIPYILFPWLEWISKKLNWKQFDKLGLTEDDYHPSNINKPFYLIHSTSDKLFDYREHFRKFVSDLSNKSSFSYWLVPEAGHTRMIKNNEYETKLVTFLMQLEVEI